VKSVECHTTNCLARLEWADGATAGREHAALAHYPYKANCGRTVLLDKERQVDGKQGAMLFFNCESWRVDGEPVADMRAVPPRSN